MKRTIITATLLIFVAIFIQSCTKDPAADKLTFGKATIKIENSGNPDSTECTIRFIPSANSTSFIYAIGTESDYINFENGTMDTECVEGNTATEIKFSNLNPLNEYSIYARAYDEDNIPGSICVYKIRTADDKFFISAEYITDKAAGLMVNYSDRNYEFEYYFGKPEDREAFLNGETENKSLTDEIGNTFVFNRLDLEPDTEYAFFAKASDRAGKYEYRELIFKTKALDDCPKVTMNIDHLDIYKGKYTIKANDKCGKVAVLTCNRGRHDAILYTDGAGDILRILDTWGNIGFYVKTSMDKEYKFEHITENMRLDNELEMYVVVYDKEFYPAGIQHFTFKTPSYDENAPSCTVDVKVTDITDNGATYTYTPDENTLGFMFETIEADWYDDFKINSGEWNEFWLHNYLFSAGMYWGYNDNNKPIVFVEKTGVPNFRYYAAACPMNQNGPDRGWQPEILVEYTTTER